MRNPSVRVSRRKVLKRAAVLAAPLVVPASALGLDGTVAVSQRIALGFIGAGAMGQGHVRCLLDYPDAQILAVCDVDRWRRENARNWVEERYGSRQSGGTFRGCHAYSDLRELLARDDVDAVVIATGDRWHALATVLAAKAGKDIYCEKPISLTIREARTMVDTAGMRTRRSRTSAPCLSAGRDGSTWAGRDTCSAILRRCCKSTESHGNPDKVYQATTRTGWTPSSRAVCRPAT
jgi:hypothetical protein